MKCPECGATENISFFLRHQAEDENDESNNANVITILCRNCGKNESYFLRDCLEDIFPSWKENDGADLAELFSAMYGGIPQADFDFEEEPAIEEE